MRPSALRGTKTTSRHGSASIDAGAVDATNRKLESFTSERMTPEDRALLGERHPVMRERPELTSILDILDAEDARAFAGEAKSPP
ncbi:MAG TPA: hypothetical protein VGC72_01930 [Candidatus Elarobacter sp.]